MAAIYFILVVCILAALTIPGIWAKYVLAQYQKERRDLPLSGKAFAAELVHKFKLDGVTIETTQPGTDHYDPINKRVCLSENLAEQHSLTAITVAAHEVGHAIQDATHYRGLSLRTRLVKLARSAGQLGNAALIAAPVVTAISKSPTIGLFVLGLAFLGFFSTTLVHMITLPVEFNASFKRALPILKDCGYLQGKDLDSARKVLTACAMTYVAQSLMSLLLLGRWLKAIRR